MMNNMKMMNDMDLAMVAGGESDNLGPAEVIPEPITLVTQAEGENIMKIILAEGNWNKPLRPVRETSWY